MLRFYQSGRHINMTKLIVSRLFIIDLYEDLKDTYTLFTPLIYDYSEHYLVSMDLDEMFGEKGENLKKYFIAQKLISL